MFDRNAKRVDMTLTGTVMRFTRRHAHGSYRNVIIDTMKQPITLGLSEKFDHPKVGDKIEVVGVMVDGRFLTQSWEYA